MTYAQSKVNSGVTDGVRVTQVMPLAQFGHADANAKRRRDKANQQNTEEAMDKRMKQFWGFKKN